LKTLLAESGGITWLVSSIWPSYVLFAADYTAVDISENDAEKRHTPLSKKWYQHVLSSPKKPFNFNKKYE
jgi:hypothetical protein